LEARTAQKTRDNPAMSSTVDQQPISRNIGKRRERDGQAMTSDDRARMTAMAGYVTRAPKGVFIYHSHGEMDADRLRWTVDAMVANAKIAVDVKLPPE